MSNRYKGGIISATPPTLVAGAGASGAWTLEQQMQATAAGLWPVNGPFYIEDVFSTWLYTGNGATQTITNGIDLAGKGGLLWLKARSSAGEHALFDTTRGTGTLLNTDSTNAARSETGLASFNSDGFSFANAGSTVAINFNGRTFASWTFREQPKFFDVVTWTGNGATYRDITTGFSNCGTIIAKCTSTTGDWWVWNRTFGSDTYLKLNTTAASSSADSPLFGSETGGTFGVAIQGSNSLNTNGATYVAYLFAHNAGGFGLSGTDNVISCGSFTTDGSGRATVNLGYEPQWVLIKQTDGVDSWYLNDNMRGMAVSGNQPNLSPNSSAAESAGGYNTYPNATGFTASVGIASKNYIYIAIRRGPMRTPTTGTSVFEPKTRSGTGGATTVTTTVRPDTVLQNWRDGGLGSASHFMYDRLRGVAQALFTDTTGAESTQTATGINAFNNLSYGIAGAGSMNNGSALYADYVFTRAPGFFDEVCYTGTGTAGQTYAHNLAVVPELMIVKRRDAVNSWAVYSSALASSEYLELNSTAAKTTGVNRFNGTAPSASVFTVGNSTPTNASGGTYVNYLFASCPGVSKVGSYTGTGTTQTINCGFTAGSRFVMIKRTDSTGDWYVWDTARGMIPANDPYLLLNSAAAEVTGTDFVDTAATGFEITSTAPAAINASGGTFIFLAIA